MRKDRNRAPVRMYNEEELRTILTRALELDLDPRQMTERDVREIAREVGVSRSSILQALDEYAAANPTETPRSRVHGWRDRLGMFGTGALLGAAFTSVTSLALLHDMSPLAWTGIVAVFGSAGSFALWIRGRFRHLDYQLGNLGIWGGLAAAMAVVAPGAHYPGLLPWAAATGIVGAAIMRIRDAIDERRHDGIDPQPGAQSSELPAPREGAAGRDVLGLLRRIRGAIGTSLPGGRQSPDFGAGAAAPSSVGTVPA